MPGVVSAVVDYVRRRVLAFVALFRLTLAWNVFGIGVLLLVFSINFIVLHIMGRLGPHLKDRVALLAMEVVPIPIGAVLVFYGFRMLRAAFRRLKEAGEPKV